MKATWLALGCIAALAACGDDTTGATTGSGGAAGSGGETSGPASGGGTPSSTSTGDATTGSGTGGGTGGEAPAGPRGEVAITLRNVGPEFPAMLLEGLFVETPACTTVASEGGCTLHRCAVEVDELDAGTLALSGGDLPATLAFDYFEDLDGALLAPGDEVAVSGPGTADVPAFELGATFPEIAEVTTPTFEEGSVAADADFPVVWSGGGAATIAVALDGSFGVDDSSFDRIVCRAPASAGSLTVPGPLLAQLVSSSASMTASVNVIGTDEASVDDWSFGLSVGRSAESPTGFAGDAFGVYDLE